MNDVCEYTLTNVLRFILAFLFCRKAFGLMEIQKKKGGSKE
jgi:hypothetical protein